MALANEVKMKIIAEGVDESEAVDALVDLLCSKLKVAEISAQ